MSGTDSSTDSTSVGYSSGTGASSWSPNESTSSLYSSILQNLYTLGNTPTEYYSGQTYVSPSELTQQGVSTGQTAADLYQSAAGQQAGVANTAGQNYNYLSTAADVANNPYVTNMMDVNKATTTQALTEDWLPAINSGAQEVNSMGSSRQGIAQAQGVERASNQLSNANQQLLSTAYGQGLNAQQSALQQTGSLQQAYASPASSYATASDIQSGLGQTVEDYQQKALDESMDRYYYQYEEPWDRMGQVSNYLTGLFGDTGTSYSSSTGTEDTTGASDTDTSKF